MRVAIVGYDVEGQASYRYFSERGDEVVIFDEAEQPKATPPEGIRVVSGGVALDTLRNETFDLVVRTPGMAPKKLEGISNVTTATRQFFMECPAPIIGVTGTKGKGTTASLIHAILTAGGKRSWLVGNIGLAALDVLGQIEPGDVVVYELSSFQLWDLDRSPHVATVLMIEPDHLDVHTGMDDYVAAKSQICRWQTSDDITVFNVSSQLASDIASTSEGRKIPFPHTDGVSAHDGYFWMNEQKLCSISSLKIVGIHNQDNACAAIAAANEYVSDPGAISKGLESFDGLPHRLQFVSTIKGIDYYDDSIATTPGSAIAALKSFDRPTVLILGGKGKGADYNGLIDLCKQRSASVIAIGETGREITYICGVKGVDVQNLGTVNMDEVVSVASSLAPKGGVVIMSPAAASFDMFRNYKDRGEQFVAAVMKLKTGS